MKVSLTLNNNNDVIVSFFLINSRNNDLSHLQLSTMFPSAMLNKFPYLSLTSVLDRKQVYNTRQRNESNAEEHQAIMRNLEKSDSIIARFSMSHGEAPAIVLSKPHMIKELKRYCINTSDQTQSSVLCEYHFDFVQINCFYLSRC